MIRLALTILFAAFATTASAQAPSCVSPNFIAAYYGADDAASFSFGQPDQVSDILGQLTTIAGPPPGMPVLIILGVDLADQTGDWFLFDADGCFFAHLGPMAAAQVQSMLDGASVDLPPATPLPGNGKHAPSI